MMILPTWAIILIVIATITGLTALYTVIIVSALLKNNKKTKK